MITIEIKKTEKVEYRETVNFVIEKTPTEFTEQSDYGNRKQVAYKEKSEPREVTKWRDVETVLLLQKVSDEEFNLVEVIKAINAI